MMVASIKVGTFLLLAKTVLIQVILLKWPTSMKFRLKNIGRAKVGRTIIN